MVEIGCEGRDDDVEAVGGDEYGDGDPHCACVDVLEERGLDV